MQGEGGLRDDEIETITRKVPKQGRMRISLKSLFDRLGIKQGDVVNVKIKSSRIERDILTRVQSQGRITIPKSQLGKEAQNQIKGKLTELKPGVVPPVESVKLFNEDKIDLRGIVSRLEGYVTETGEGIKIGLDDGRGHIRTLTPQDIQMDLERFFENVGRNIADNDGAQGLTNMDPKMINDYIKYLEDMGLPNFGYQLSIASHHELSDTENQEYLRHRIMLNPELPANTPVYNKVYEPTENPKRNPIGNVRIGKENVPLRQIHKEALKIVREAIEGKFSPQICRQICQSFVRGAVGGDGGIDVDKRGRIEFNYTEQDPDIRAIVRDAIKEGYDVKMKEYHELRTLRTRNMEDIKNLANQRIGGSNALRGGRLLGELIRRTEGAEREEFEKKLQELAPWLRLYIKVVRELERRLPGSVVPKWKDFIRLLEDILPPEDISIGFKHSPPGS